MLKSNHYIKETHWMKFLLLQMKTVCYNSYNYFSECLGDELEKLGHRVEYFRLIDESYNSLERYVGTNFDAIIDFNSELPRAFMDDNSYFLDHIDAPFYDFILDHPLYHYKNLVETPHNFNVICLDDNHKNYIKEHHPHIKKIIVQPLTGNTVMESDNNVYDNYINREYDLLFTGTYTPPNDVMNAINELPFDINYGIKSSIDMMTADENVTVEETVRIISKEPAWQYMQENIPLYTSKLFFLADSYVRAKSRHDTVLELDKCHHKLHIFGGLWDKCPVQNAILHNEVSFPVSMLLQSKAKIALNTMPNFKSGCHDRVYSSQLNKAISLTNSTILLQREYVNNQSILFYSSNNLNNLAERVDSILADNNINIKIAQNGYLIASNNHNWTKITMNILEQLI